MDQVKIYLRLLAKHHFWLVVVIASLFGLFSWWKAAGGLASETKTHWEKVKGSYTALEGVGGGQKPANGKFAAGVGEKNEQLKKTVLEEWRSRYDAQQKHFAWPEIVAADMAKLGPDQAISQSVRQVYMDNAFPKTLEDMVFLVADYRRPKELPPVEEKKEDEGPEAAGNIAAPEAAEMEGLVAWDAGHREALRQRYDLREHGKRQGVPSTLNVRLAQEDVWMLQNLASVVRATNEGAQDVGAVPIKKIDSLDIAQWAINDAVREAPKVSGLEKTAEGGTSPMAMTGPSGALGGPGGGESTTPTSGDELEKALDDELLNGRYLSDQGVPTTAGEPPPYAEFKLMFVRLKVIIDQRKIPDLLVNCANAPVPIEVVRFRMEDPVAPSGNHGGGAQVAAPAPGPMGGGGGLRGGLLGAGGGLAGGAGGRAAVNVQDIEATPADVTVEVCGVVQIYNPPDETKLGSGSAGDPAKRTIALPTAAVKPPRTMQPGGGTGGGGLMGRRQ